MIGGPMSGIVWSLMKDWRQAEKRGASRQNEETKEPNAKASNPRVQRLP